MRWKHNRTRTSLAGPAIRRRGGAGTWVIAATSLTAVIALGVGILSRSGSENDDDVGSPSQAPEWFTVDHRSFDLTVVATGELEAKRQVEVKNRVQGETTIVELVEEGTSVKAGDLLMKLADDDIRERIEQETLRVEESRANKVAAEQNLAIKQSEASSDRKAAELKLALAKLELDKWTRGTVPQKRLELELALARAQSDVERTARDYVLSQELFDQKFISESEKDDDYIQMIEAQAAIQTAKLNIEVYEQYSYPMDERKFTSDVEQAKGEVDRTLQKNESELERLRADLESKTRSLAIRESRLADLEEQLEATDVRAPQEGLVVYATSAGSRWRRGSEPIQQGRRVRYNESLVILPDTRQMVAVLRVHEAMLPNVEIGQDVAVTIDARPGLPMNGKVSQIGVMAEEGGWLNPQLREYSVRVDLPPQTDPDESSGLKPAMRCRGEILVGRVENAVAVPVQSVFTEGDNRFCYLRAGRNRVRKCSVKIGRASDTFVEIHEGLSDGDRVLLRNPRPGEVVRG
ncbi:MAG: efflux RND transporter periplasmic adaptor subunit [Phycisphaeraceae bacterium]